MGFVEKVGESVEHGANSVGRGAKKLQLNNQLSDIKKQRSALCAELGAQLYEMTKDSPSYRDGREQLYTGIANLDSQRDAVQAQIDEIEAEAAREAEAKKAAAAVAAAATPTCPSCGAAVGVGDRFCVSCGSPLPEFKPAEPAKPVCPNCGKQANPGDSFCMECGTRLEAAPAPAVAAEPAPMPEPEPIPVPEPMPEPEPLPEPEPMPAPEPAGERVFNKPIQQAEPAPEPEPAAAEQAAPVIPAGAPAFVPAGASTAGASAEATPQ